mgnify:CR=1 FL=1
MRTLTNLALAAFFILSASCSSQSKLPQDQLLQHEKEISEIISKMSLDEKVLMLHSKTIMSSEGVPSQGIQEIRYADGPFSVREEVGEGFRPLGWETDYATYFPTGSALAATWSPELAYAYGNGIGAEARLRGKDVMLGPAINIQRLPLCGRTYEYLSEDPFLSGRLAVEYVKGMQDAGTAACVKHFALNNQETNRGSVDVTVDERTMREIYLKPFEAAVREGGAMVIMPAYNKVLGKYCSENDLLNNKILRGEWGFKGFTVSDWGGTHSTMGAALGGLNVQMTGDNYLGPALADSVRAGKISEKVVDEKVREILRVRFAIKAVPESEANKEVASRPESRRTALDVARKSIVLLKNEGALLPLKARKIAIIGAHAETSTAAGGIGAGAKPPYEITPLQGIQEFAKNAGVEIVYAKGYNETGPIWIPKVKENPKVTQARIDEAIAAAKDAELVIFVAGTGKWVESEGFDRTSITLPNSQDALLASVAEVNPNVVTVVISGAPVDLRSAEPVSKAIVQGWWNGLESGTALAEVLFGKIAPSGKLPFTFPCKLEDSPAIALGTFTTTVAGGDLFTNMFRDDITGKDKAGLVEDPKAEYKEGMLVGYRWYDTKDIAPMYAFGHGLSYVDFDYQTLKVEKKNKIVKVSVRVANLGAMDADEVVQLYVTREGGRVEWPAQELKAFKRVSVPAGATTDVELDFNTDDLRYWDAASQSWKDDDSSLSVCVGSSSRDIRVKAQVK